jgi:divalent metal cation (Fe/Co/Zn/Cd) transporter
MNRHERKGTTRSAAALNRTDDGLPWTAVPAATDARASLLRRGLRLEYTTLGWNVVGIVISLVAAVAARSVALAGFALDSGVEIFASLVVVGELKGTSSEASQRRAERRIGCAFLALAVYLTAQAVVTIVADVHPYSSPIGIAWLAASAVAMFSLAYGKAVTGRLLDYTVLQAEAKVTVVDGALAAATLLGLTLNAALGWWWADVAAGVVIVAYGVREGLHLLRSST